MPRPARSLALAPIAAALACFAGVPAALAAPAGPAAGELVYVFEPLADFATQPQAQALANVLRLRIGDGGELALASENPAFVTVAHAAKCDLRGYDKRELAGDADRGVDAGCQKRVAARLGAKRYFWGHFYKGEGGRLFVKLHLWQEGAPERVKALPYDPSARERLAERFYQALVHHDRAGELALSSAEPLEGELWVDGRPGGAYARGLELTLLAGEHTLEVRREGKAAARAKATVVAGERVEAKLAPIFEPRVDIDPTEGFAEPSPAAPPSSWRRPAGFVGLGLGAVALGAGLFSSLRVRSLDGDFAKPSFVAYREGVARRTDACDAAEQGVASMRPGAASPGEVRDACASVGRYQALQYVFYGLGALSTGVGTYLLLSAPSRDASTAGAKARAGWHVRPEVGPRAAGVTLGRSF